MPSRSNRARPMKSSRVSNSASVSPGNPTMKVVRMARPGIPARNLPINCLTRARFLRPQVHPVIRRVLTDQIYLTHAFLDESSDLREHRFRIPTPVFSPHPWNHAKTTRVVAALGNFNISRVRWGKSETRSVVIRNITGMRGDEVVVEVGSWGSVS